jgi:hypothetical protein
VLGSLVEAIGMVGDDLVPAERIEAYRAWVRDTFAPVLRDVGWRPVGGEPDDRRAVRGLAVRAMGEVGRDPVVVERARAIVDAYLAGRAGADGSAASPAASDGTLLDAAVAVASVNGDAPLYDRLLARYRSASSPEERSRCLYALADFEAPALIERTIDLALTPAVRTQDVGLLIQAVLDAPGGWTQAWPIVQRRWAEISKRLDPFFGGPDIVTGTGSFCVAPAAQDVQTFFAAHPVPGAARTVEQSIERISSCAALAGAERSRLSAWLEADAQKTNGTSADVRRR